MIYSVPKLKSKWTNKIVNGVCSSYKSKKGETCLGAYHMKRHCGGHYCTGKYVF